MGIFMNKADYAFKRNYDNDEKTLKPLFKNIHKNLNLYERPETYKTILQSEYGNNSQSICVRRKINSLINKQMLLSTDIKIGKGRSNIFKIFFPIEKDYFIVICEYKCYYCDKVINKDKSLLLLNSYILNGDSWQSKGDEEILLKEVIKCL